MMEITDDIKNELKQIVDFLKDEEQEYYANFLNRTFKLNWNQNGEVEYSAELMTNILKNMGLKNTENKDIDWGRVKTLFNKFANEKK